MANVETIAAKARTPPSFHPVELEPPPRERKHHPHSAKIDFQGIPIYVENAPGEHRYGTDTDGHEWATRMLHAYGEIPRTKGTDGDRLDVFVGPNHDSPLVVLVDTNDPTTGEFDEQKALIGWDRVQDALDAFKLHYDRPGVYRSHTTMPIGQFKRLIEDRANRGRAIEAKAMDSRDQLKRWARGLEKASEGLKKKVKEFDSFDAAVAWLKRNSDYDDETARAVVAEAKRAAGEEPSKKSGEKKSFGPPEQSPASRAGVLDHDTGAANWPQGVAEGRREDQKGQANLVWNDADHDDKNKLKAWAKKFIQAGYEARGRGTPMSEDEPAEAPKSAVHRTGQLEAPVLNGAPEDVSNPQIVLAEHSHDVAGGAFGYTSMSHAQDDARRLAQYDAFNPTMAHEIAKIRCKIAEAYMDGNKTAKDDYLRQLWDAKARSGGARKSLMAWSRRTLEKASDSTENAVVWAVIRNEVRYRCKDDDSHATDAPDLASEAVDEAIIHLSNQSGPGYESLKSALDRHGYDGLVAYARQAHASVHGEAASTESSMETFPGQHLTNEGVPRADVQATYGVNGEGMVPVSGMGDYPSYGVTGYSPTGGAAGY